MALSLERLKYPSLIEDAKIVNRNGKRWSIISYSSFISVYVDNELEIVDKCSIPARAIVLFDLGFFIISEESYAVCYYKTIDAILKQIQIQIEQKKTPEKYTICNFPKCVLNINAQPVFYANFFPSQPISYPNNSLKMARVYQTENGLLIFINRSNKYSIGCISKDRIVFDVALSDTNFYNIIHAASSPTQIALVASTISKKYLFVYFLEQGLVKSYKKEIANGSIVSYSRNRILLVDKDGIFSLDKNLVLEKSSVFHKEKLTFIKEIGNYMISYILHDDSLDRNILFCKNGEVIVLDKENRHNSVGFMSGAVLGAMFWGSYVLCFSKTGCWLLDLDGQVRVVNSHEPTPADVCLLKQHYKKDDLNDPLLQLVADHSEIFIYSKIDLEADKRDFLLNKKIKDQLTATANPEFSKKALKNPSSSNDYEFSEKSYETTEKSDIGSPANDHLTQTDNKKCSSSINEEVGSDINLTMSCNSDMLFSSQHNQKDVLDQRIFNPQIEYRGDHSLIDTLKANIKTKNSTLKGFQVENNNLLLTFSSFSILNGFFMRKIDKIATYDQMLFLYADQDLFLIKEGTVFKRQIHSYLTRFYTDLAAFYFQNTILILYLGSLTFIQKKVDFDLSDLSLQNDIVVCLDVNYNVHTFELKDFEKMPYCFEETRFGDLEMQTSVLRATEELSYLGRLDKFYINKKSKDILHDETLRANEDDICMGPKPLADDGRGQACITNVNVKENCKHQCSSNQFSSNLNRFRSPYIILTFNGKIFRFTNGSIDLMFDCFDYINDYTISDNYLIVISKYSFCYDLESKRPIMFHQPVKGFSIFSEKVYLFSDDEIYCFNGPASQLIFNFKDYGLDKQSRLLMSYKKNPIYVKYSCDYSALSLTYRECVIKFNNAILAQFTKLGENHFLVTLNYKEGFTLSRSKYTPSNSCKSTLVLFKMNSKRLRILKTFYFDDFIYGLSSLGSTVAVVFAQKIQIYKLINSCLIKKKEVPCKSYCKSVQFNSKNEIRINNNDWSYLDISIKSGAVTTYSSKGNIIPFELNNAKGYAYGQKLYIEQESFDLYEEVISAFPTKEGVIMFCRNGSIISLRNTKDESDEVKNLYSSQISVYNCL